MCSTSYNLRMKVMKRIDKQTLKTRFYGFELLKLLDSFSNYI